MSKNLFYIVVATSVGLKSPLPDGRQFARQGERIDGSLINVKWLTESGAVIPEGPVEEIASGRKRPEPVKAPEPPKTFGFILAEIAEKKADPVVMKTVMTASLTVKPEEIDLDLLLATASPIELALLTEEDAESVREIAAGTSGIEFDEDALAKIAADPELFKSKMLSIGSRKTKPSVDVLKDEYLSYLARISQAA